MKESKPKVVKAPKYQLNIYKTDDGYYTAQFIVDGVIVQEVKDPNSYQVIFGKFEPSIRLAPYERP